jgi:signal transduction histidine kinase/DNA-binding response OmpR family regulator
MMPVKPKRTVKVPRTPVMGQAKPQHAQTDLLSRLTKHLGETLDVAQVLQSVVADACQLTGAKYGALGIFDEDGRITQFITHGISDDLRKQIGNPPVGKGILGLLQQTSKPLRLDDLSKHPQSVGFPANHPKMKSFLGAPLRLGDESFGNIYLTDKTGGIPFTERDEHLLTLFSSHAAVVLRNARFHHSVAEAMRQLETIIDLSPTGVLCIESKTHKALIFNQEAKRILRINAKPGEVFPIGKTGIESRTPDGRKFDAHEPTMQRALSRGERTIAQEMRLVFPDGQSTLVLINSTPLFNPAGEVTSVVSTIMDLTPLEDAERERNEFLGMVSHELKTPLTAIKGSAATALGSKRPLNSDETRDLFSIIDEQADRLRDLVDNLLDMSRIESGTLSVYPEPVDALAIVKEAVTQFSRSTPGRDVQVLCSLPSLWVTADKRRVVQVFLNLLTNAAKFSPDQSPITIAVTPSDQTAEIAIRDTGRGIPPDKIGSLFRKFSQVHSDAKGKLGGTGLGLAICKGIVEAHGGRIWARSDGPGKGSTFAFTLPLSAIQGKPSAKEPEQASVSSRANLMGSVSHAGERTRILAVDDDPQILRLVRRVLEEAGYKPILARGADELFALMDGETPDLFLLDMNLPGATGLDLLKRIRESSGTPVIFLTAVDSPEMKAKALKAGADDYITKPFSPIELTARIEASLRRHSMGDVLDARPPFTLGDLSISFSERLVTIGGRPVQLSATEYKILYQLATNAGRVLTHDQILHRVWGPEYSGETELVRSFIRNLRSKLRDDVRNPRYVLTEPQVGYRMPKP